MSNASKSRGPYSRSRMMAVVGHLLQPGADLDSISHEFRLRVDHLARLQSRAMQAAEWALREDDTGLDLETVSRLSKAVTEARARIAVLRAVLAISVLDLESAIRNTLERDKREVINLAQFIAGASFPSEWAQEELSTVGKAIPLPRPFRLESKAHAALPEKAKPGPKPKFGDAQLVDEIRNLGISPSDLPGYRAIHEKLKNKGVIASPQRVRAAVSALKAKIRPRKGHR